MLVATSGDTGSAVAHSFSALAGMCCVRDWSYAHHIAMPYVAFFQLLHCFACIPIHSAVMPSSARPSHPRIPATGDVAQWLGRRSLAGGLSLICA